MMDATTVTIDRDDQDPANSLPAGQGSRCVDDALTKYNLNLAGISYDATTQQVTIKIMKYYITINIYLNKISDFTYPLAIRTTGFLENFGSRFSFGDDAFDQEPP